MIFISHDDSTAWILKAKQLLEQGTSVTLRITKDVWRTQRVRLYQRFGGYDIKVGRKEHEVVVLINKEKIRSGQGTMIADSRAKERVRLNDEFEAFEGLVEHKCACCGKFKDSKCFNRRGDKDHQRYCKECQLTYQRWRRKKLKDTGAERLSDLGFKRNCVNTEFRLWLLDN